MKYVNFGDNAFLPGAGAVVSFTPNTYIADETNIQSIPITPKNSDTEIQFVPYGIDNNLPVDIMDKVQANVTVASNVEFNARIAFGDGIMVTRKVRNSQGQIIHQELLPSEAPEVFEFLQNNNITRLFQDCAQDMMTFSDSFVEFVLNRQKTKIVKIRQKDLACSRLSLQNETTGKIEYHGYSAKWGETLPDDVIITPFLDRETPLFDLKQKMGKIPNDNGQFKQSPSGRYICSLGLPVPGRFYYNKPNWWSVFASGWYDFSCAIPHFKRALMENEMVLKYHISINEDFWEKLYRSEGITKDDAKASRKHNFLMQMNDFLSGKKNAGKSFISFFGYDKIKGFETKDIKIEPVDSFIKGGEYIEDSEECSNILCYAMGVHPSLQGASPGKNKTISGTEARELFIIKQAMTRPIREALLAPLYIIKEINGWDKDIHFVIPNIMLTTLDQNTGAVKSIGSQIV